MDPVNMKKWLKRAFYANKKIEALNMRIQQCKDQATRLARLSGESNNASKGNSTESALLKLAEMEETAKKQISEAINVTAQIEGKIAELHDNDLEAILIHRYILFHSIEKTAELLNYHENTVKCKTKIAIKKLCTQMS